MATSARNEPSDGGSVTTNSNPTGTGSGPAPARPAAGSRPTGPGRRTAAASTRFARAGVQQWDRRCAQRHLAKCNHGGQWGAFGVRYIVLLCAGYAGLAHLCRPRAIAGNTGSALGPRHSDLTGGTEHARSTPDRSGLQRHHAHCLCARLPGSDRTNPLVYCPEGLSVTSGATPAPPIAQQSRLNLNMPRASGCRASGRSAC